MLEWSKLLNGERRKGQHKGEKEDSNTKGPRDEAERDYDRILFAGPTRRLADKTQVFPLDSNDSVRTRLTHSHEVSNLARSIGIRLAFEHAEEVFGKDHDALNVKRKIPAILAAIGLAHDLGNPPFGHQGEGAIKQWFIDNANKLTDSKDGIHQDFSNFDGNPQTFRLVTKLQILNDDFGLNLTHATLAAMIKYPWFSTSTKGNRFHTTKFGVFESERNVIEDVWRNTGLSEGIRHPLTYVMEACDDIAYSVLDAEDTVKKHYASFYDLMEHLKQNKADPVIKKVIEYSEKKNKLYRKESLTSSELNEISMQMFRVSAIGEMIAAVTAQFVSSIEGIMDNSIPSEFELIKNSSAGALCSSLKKFDRLHGYNNTNVLRLELEGHNYITKTMDMLWKAIHKPELPFSRYAITQISENYKRAKKSSTQENDYKDLQLLADSIAGMTDNYLISTYTNLHELYKNEIS